MHFSRIVLSLTGGFFAEIVNKLVPLLILRFVVQRLGVDGYGQAQFSYWMIDMAVAFVVAGYATVAAVEIGQNRDDPLRMARVISEVLSLKLVHAVLAFLALMLTFAVLPSYARYQPVVLALSFILATSAIDMSFVHVGTSRMFSLSVLTISVKLVSLGSILLCVHTPDDLILFALLYFGANGAIGLGNFLLNARRFPLMRPTLTALKTRFTLSLPFAVTAFLSLSLERYDVFVIEHLLGPTGAGLYSGPVRIAQAMVNVVSVIGMVFFAEVVGTKDKEALTRHVNLACWAMLALLLPLALGSYFLGGEVLNLLLGPTFKDLGLVLTVLLTALIASSWINVFGLQVLMFHRRAYIINGVLALATVFGIGLSLILKDHLGMIGIAVATLSSRTLAAVLFLFFARRYLLRLPFREFVRTALPTLGMGLVLAFLPAGGLALSLGIGAAVYGALLVGLNRGKIQTLVATVKRRAV